MRRGWVHDGLAGEAVAQAPVTRADGRLRLAPRHWHALCGVHAKGLPILTQPGIVASETDGHGNCHP